MTKEQINCMIRNTILEYEDEIRFCKSVITNGAAGESERADAEKRLKTAEAGLLKTIGLERGKTVSIKIVAHQPTVFFWKDEKENGCFSNWYPRRFEVDGLWYLHVEQYMMAQKAKLFDDMRLYEEIMQTEDPARCKKLGRLVSSFDPAVWNTVKYDIVKTANRAKFEQNPDLKEALLKTGNAVFAEASPYDSIWGIGITASEAAKMDPSEWPGQNLLGKILAELREEL